MIYKEIYRKIQKIEALFNNLKERAHKAVFAKRLSMEIDLYKRTAPDDILNPQRLYLNKLEKECYIAFHNN